MSFNIEGKQCKSCNAYLFPEDDVVFCPVCGAPHHRECYNALGHCALEHLHGTDEQYDSSKEEKKNEEKEAPPTNNKVLVTCGMCGEKYDANESACPNCKTPNAIKMGGRFITFDFLGGIPSDTDLGDGVTADEAKQFVLSNPQRYIPKFARMKDGKKASFNLLAFFFPCAWALSRKMYKLGALLGAITVALTMLVIPFQETVLTSVPDEIMGNYSKFALYITENIEFFYSPTLFVAFGATIIMIAIKIIMGVFGDYFYRNFAIKTIKEIKETSVDKQEDMRKKGGASLLFLILGILVTEYLPIIITSFAGL